MAVLGGPAAAGGAGGFQRVPAYRRPEILNEGGVPARGGGITNRTATAGAKAFKDALGLPSYEDLLGKFGSGFGTREFGNAGAAGEGASYLKGEYEAGKKGLRAQQANLNAARRGIQNPTGTTGFKNVMRLTNERLGNAAENDRRLAAEAAARRGYVGGYSGERNDRDRLEALATAGYEAAGAEREAQQKLFGGEADLYGTMLAGQSPLLSGYTDLTRTQAELPTKWLDSYSNLLSGLGGQFGDIFGTASQNTRFDIGNEREDMASQRRGRPRIGPNVGYM